MSKNIPVSVIIPTYNRAYFIPDAIKSIQKQNYPNLEIIVVDDGSTDNTKEIIESFGEAIKYVFQENKGPSAARNTGIKIAKGKIIGFLDSDDLWPDNKLDLQLKPLIKDKNISVIVGGLMYVKFEDNVEDKKYKELREKFLSISMGSTLFRKAVFEKVGLLNEELIHWEDLDWFLRAYALNIKVKKLNEITLIARTHSTNITKDRKENVKYLSKVLKSSLDRIRKSKAKYKNKPLDWPTIE